jgi:hypothetical protein
MKNADLLADYLSILAQFIFFVKRLI